MIIAHESVASRSSRRHPRLDRRLVDIAELEGEQAQVIICHDASEKSLANSLGFSPLIDPKSGARYPVPSFDPFFVIRDHDGFFEFRARFGRDGGLTVVLFFWDNEQATDAAILEMCRERARRPSN